MIPMNSIGKNFCKKIFQMCTIYFYFTYILDAKLFDKLNGLLNFIRLSFLLTMKSVLFEELSHLYSCIRDQEFILFLFDLFQLLIILGHTMKCNYNFKRCRCTV